MTKLLNKRQVMDKKRKENEALVGLLEKDV